jgi:cysteine synthase B
LSAENASPQRKRILRSFGVNVVETDPSSQQTAQLKARQMFEAEPQKYFYPDQYNNQANWRVPCEGIAPETGAERRTDHALLAGLGTRERSSARPAD